MTFNSEKFECLRYWPKVTKPEISYKAPDGDVIEEKESLRDLGIAMSNDLSFSTHILLFSRVTGLMIINIFVQFME